MTVASQSGNLNGSRLEDYLMTPPTCRSANRTDTQTKWRTLPEPGELGRSYMPASARMNVADLGENDFGVLFPRETDLSCLAESRPCQTPSEGKEKKRPGWEYQPGRSG